MEVGAIVWANAYAVTGLPYRAKIEAIKGDKARVRPQEHAFTAGSVRHNFREGPSLKARWVKLSGLSPVAS